MDWDNKNTAANVSAWFLAPHPEVGATMGSLRNAPIGCDTASKAGCKSQSYTSWASFSRSYLCGFTQKTSLRQAEAGAMITKNANAFDMKTSKSSRPTTTAQADDPTTGSTSSMLEKVPKAMWDILSTTQQNDMKAGRLMYHDGLLITPEQAMMILNMSTSEYTLWMISTAQTQAASFGVSTLGPDNLDVKRTYNLALKETANQLRGTMGARAKRHAKSNKGKTSATPNNATPATTPASAAPETAITEKSVVDRKRETKQLGLRRTLTDAEMEQLLDDIEDLEFTDAEIMEALAIDKEETELMMADTTKTSTGGIPFNTLPPTLLPYSTLMHKERARVIKEYYTKAGEDRKAARPTKAPVINPDAEKAAAELMAVRRVAVQQSGVNLPQYKSRPTTQAKKALARTLRSSGYALSTPDVDNSIKRDSDTGDDKSHSIPTIKRPLTDLLVDHIPMRSVAVSTYPLLYEQQQNIPYSPIYGSMSERLSDPTQSGTLGAIVRSANIRDATSFMSLVKALRTNPGSIMDIAPLMRLALLSSALDWDTAASDLTGLQFVRNAFETETIIEIQQKPREYFPNSQVIAMPLDTYIAYMSNGIFLPANVNEGFKPSRVDTTWTAIPMRSALVGQNHIREYIMAFLHSDLTNGSVNWIGKNVYVDTQTGNPMEPTDVSIDQVTHTLRIPASNSVLIPAPKSAVIVLTDVTSANATTEIDIGGVMVHVWTGNAPMIPGDFAALWRAWFVQQNIQQIRQNLVNAYNEISSRLATLNTASIALSLTADIITAARPGVAVQSHAGQPQSDYDLDTAVSGGIGFLPNSAQQNFNWVTLPLTYGSQLKGRFNRADIWGAASNHRQIKMSTINGFNQASLSSHHLTPSGYCTVEEIGAADNPIEVLTAMINPDSYMQAPSYQVTTASSIMRVATYVGLIDTHPDSLQFRSAGGLPAWLVMLSVAQSANTALFLATNNMTTAQWSGQYTAADDMHGTAYVAQAKSAIFSEYIIHNMIFRQSTYAGWEYYLADDIRAFYQTDFDSINWWSASFVPVHLTLQWANKLGLADFPSIPEVTWFQANGTSMRALPIEEKTSMTKISMTSTIDFSRYNTRIIYCDEIIQLLWCWVDMYSSLSLIQSGSHCKTKTEFLESATTTITPKRVNLPYVDPARVFVINSTSMNKSATVENINVNNIQYPDPPTWEKVLSATKNYVLGPATAGLMGLLAAGPTGAAIGAGTDLARQAISDVLKQRNETREREKEEKEKQLAMERAQLEAAQQASRVADPPQINPPDGTVGQEGPHND